MKKQRRKSNALPPRTLPAWWLRNFGKIDPEAAERVAEYVQREAVDRIRGKSVAGALSEIAEQFGWRSRSRGFEVLRAGRHLLWRKRRA
jgi:hypothetical protein